MPEPSVASYKSALESRDAAERRARRERLGEALETARRAADLLRERFGVEQAILFGSIARRELPVPRTDIDLALSELGPEPYLEAVAAVQDLSPHFSVDLVLLDRCAPELRATIEREGIRL